MKKNLKKTILLSITLLMLSFMTLKAQSLNPTSSINANGSADLFKGGYTFAYATSGTPWNGSLLSYGGFAPNNYDTQISSDYGPHGGNHISYRTKNGDTNTWNPWNELATKGQNNFNGNQNINGSQSLTGNLLLGPDGGISTISGPANSGAIQIKTNGGSGGSANRYLRLGFKDNNAVFNTSIAINEDLNVGVGILNPNYKLDVNGTIHSQEVKVDMNGWSDFVFKKEYDLPTLQEVEKHINEKGHLENIPSEEEVLKNGINLGEMNAKLLQKIEEVTLHLIEKDKQINFLLNENTVIKRDSDEFRKLLLNRLETLEKKTK